MVKPTPARHPRQWWLPSDGQRASHPVFTPALFGLPSRSLDLVLTLGVLLGLALSRVVAFPACIWEQDEAYFGCAVLQFEPTINHPHPPWFPLWIALGTLLHPAGAEPATGLQLASAALSVWAVFPLASLFSRLMRRGLATAAATLALLLPGPWLLAGRAFSETPATALLALAAACWAVEPASRRTQAAGSCAAGLCLLVRPQLVLTVAAMALMVLVRWRSGRAWTAVLAPAAVLVTVGFAGVAVAAGGLAPLRTALAIHAGIHFGAMDASSFGFAASGLARCLASPTVAAGWVLAGLVGLGALLRRHAILGLPTGVLAASLIGLVVTIWGLSNPAHPRYSLPLLALSAGPLAVGLAVALGRWALPALGVAGLASAWLVLPVTPTYRASMSPPVAAVRAAVAEAERRAAVVVADPTLVAFVELERVRTGIPVTVLYADQIESGQTPPPPSFATVAVWDDGHDALVARAPQREVHGCTAPLLRRLAQDRFLDITVAPGASLRPPSAPVPPTTRAR